MNLTIPSGLTSGDNDLDIAGPDSYTAEVLIPIGGTAAAASDRARQEPRRRAVRRHASARRCVHAGERARRGEYLRSGETIRRGKARR